MNRIDLGGRGLVLLMAGALAVPAFGQGAGETVPPGPAASPAREDGQGGAGGAAAVPTPPEPSLQPLTNGPLHEAFLSPRKDKEPEHVAKTPPAPITERPAVDPPSTQAEW